MEIPFRGQITLDILRRMNRTLLTPSRGKLIAVCLFGLFILWGVAGVPLLSGQPVSLEGYWPILLFLLAFAAVLGYSLYVSPRKVLQSSVTLQSPFSGEAKEMSLLLETAHSRSEIPWDAFLKRRIGRDIVLLYQSIQGVILMPREFFASDDDWQAFLDLVRQRVPERAPKSRGGDGISSTLNRFLLWVTIFIVIILLWNVFQR